MDWAHKNHILYYLLNKSAQIVTLDIFFVQSWAQVSYKYSLGVVFVLLYSNYEKIDILNQNIFWSFGIAYVH